MFNLCKLRKFKVWDRAFITSCCTLLNFRSSMVYEPSLVPFLSLCHTALLLFLVKTLWPFGQGVHCMYKISSQFVSNWMSYTRKERTQNRIPCPSGPRPHPFKKHNQLIRNRPSLSFCLLHKTISTLGLPCT